VLVFARRPLLPQKWMLRAQILAVALVVVLYQTPNLYALLGLHAAAMFFTAMVCHGELARLRPVAAHLTEFYLWMSIGGVVGGFLAGIVAPLAFDGVYEYPIALFLALCLRPSPEERASPAGAHGAKRAVRWALDLALPALAWWLLSTRRLDENMEGPSWWRTVLDGGLQWLASVSPSSEASLRAFEPWALTLSVVVVIVCLALRPWRFALGFIAVLLALSPTVLRSPHFRIFRERSFFGVYSVNACDLVPNPNPNDPQRWMLVPRPDGSLHYLVNGTTTHGAQNRERPLGPLTYYFREGPAGQFFDILKDTPSRGKRIGAIGLGVGVLAAYVTHDQRMTYYEIDPLDERIARDPRYFTYLKDAGDKVDVVIGDGRLSLSREEDGKFDALVVDAFSGDAIPAHMLTREAFALYFRKLKPEGLLLMHVTNAYLDLLPVVSRLVADANLAARYSTGVMPTLTLGGEPSDWVVIARQKESIARFGWIPTPWEERGTDSTVDLWTDDFTNIVQVLRWSGFGNLTD